MEGWLFGALLGGLIGSPHCVGMCGGFAAAASDAPVAYHLGRLSTYTVLGAAAGTVGAIIPGPPMVSAVVSLVVLGFFSLRLGGIVPTVHVGSGRVVEAGRRLIGREGPAGRWALGAATALLPCGLVWAALGVAVGANHPGWGALSMAAFWLGTVPLLAGAAAGVQRFARRSRGARLAVAALVFAAGAWSIARRTAAAPVSDGAPPTCHDVE
ncbi:MAG: sulfite exporter TauE/SafE [Myxococcota bacterium]|jgi:sulfite exporter TauE/SafE